LNGGTWREHVKEKLKDDFDVNPIVDYEKGKETAILRFRSANGAIEVAKKMERAGKEIQIQEAKVKFCVLEGEEEIRG
jgi:hypothetical protein